MLRVKFTPSTYSLATTKEKLFYSRYQSNTPLVTDQWKKNFRYAEKYEVRTNRGVQIMHKNIEDLLEE